MEHHRKYVLSWLDGLWLLFLLALALLPPIREVHKQLTLLAIGVFQLLQRRLLARFPRRGPTYAVLVKIALATVLLGHTGELSINSSYYPIFYLPVITAAIYFGPAATLFWTAVASLSYCSYLYPALQEYELTRAGLVELATRILFFFVAAVIVNTFVLENRRQVKRYQELSETLAEANRQLEAAQDEARRSERLAALGQLSAGLAHEIRNPLGVIKGSAEMLTQKLKEAQPLASELAGYILSEVNRLNALVGRFLDFARPSRLDHRALDATALLDRALEAVRAQMPSAPVTVVRNYAAGLPPLYADEQLCEQIFVNLFTNAYQAMSASGGSLQVTAEPDTLDGRAGVAIEVQDSGPGIPADMRQQIFNPFVSSKKDGVGLGLSIVAKIVDDHHGSIRLKSGPGGCFRVFLPSNEERVQEGSDGGDSDR
jgi:two-component system, NtrC family, sensor histidine kinase HydH